MSEGETQTEEEEKWAMCVRVRAHVREWKSRERGPYPADVTVPNCFHVDGLGPGARQPISMVTSGTHQPMGDRGYTLRRSHTHVSCAPKTLIYKYM